MIEWYKKYRIRKTIAKKYREAAAYIRPGYNIKNTMKRIAMIHLEIKKLTGELK